LSQKRGKKVEEAREKKNKKRELKCNEKKKEKKWRLS